jgi:hypothetical protein
VTGPTQAQGAERQRSHQWPDKSHSTDLRHPEPSYSYPFAMTAATISGWPLACQATPDPSTVIPLTMTAIPPGMSAAKPTPCRSTSMAAPHVAPQKQPWGAWQRDGQLIRYSPISTNPAMSLNWPSNKKMAAR